MAETVTYIKDVNEKIKHFNNNRLREACQDMPVTDVQMDIIHGQPAVTLICESREATEEDVKQELAKNIGNPIVEEPMLECSVCPLSAAAPGDADESESFMEKIYELAAGDVVEVDIQRGSMKAWVELPEQVRDKMRKANPALKKEDVDVPIYTDIEVNWALVVWLAGDDEDDESDVDPAEDDEKKPPQPKKATKAKKAKKEKTQKAKKAKKADDIDPDDESEKGDKSEKDDD